MPEDLIKPYARVAVPEQGRTWLLGRDERLSFGRDPAMDIAFPDEPRLSRCAGEIRWVGDGILIVNLSRSHALHVRSPYGDTRLPPAAEDGPGPGVFVGGGTVDVIVAGWRTSGRKLVVEVHSGSSGFPADQRINARFSATQTPLTLNPETKEFIIALLLCRPRLLGGLSAASPPPVPELAHQILTVTNSWHLLRQLDTDETIRARLTGRIHEHLKQLRAKLSNRGLVPPGVRLTPAAIADLLIEHDVVAHRHLALLDNPAWLARQEERWWK